MQYRVLGPLEVLDEGRVLDLGRPKQRAVLAVLVLEANGVVSLDRLIDLLWGEERPASSTASLQVYVSNLRRVLEAHREPRATARVLLTQPPGYLLRIEPGELDATRFETLAATGRRLLAEGRARPARQTLEDALALWRGDALADFAYQEFARPSVGRWNELRQVAIEDRIEADLALGAHAPAVGELESLVARFPLRERPWGLLMVALYRCGRQADALRTARKARMLLMNELGVDPGPDLAGLEADILAHATTLGWQRRPDSEGLAPILLTPPTRPDTGSGPPMVGRSAQLASLEAALGEAAAGQGHAVLISGEPGVGKTRLAEELAARASAAGASVAWGGAHEGDGAPVFWPWVQVLREILDPDAEPDSYGPGAPWLAQLVPEAATQFGSPGKPPALDAESARFALYEAVGRALSASAARRPLLVILEDLHWADVASLALLELLASRLRGTRLLVVGTYRPAEMSRDHPLVATLAALARQPLLERITLAGLSQEEVGSFVAAGWAVTPSEPLAAALHARTEGNPFFLTELVRLLASEGTLGRAEAVAAAHVPAGVRDVLRRRLGRLPEATNALLRVAAAIGRDFDLGILAAASDHDEERTLEAVEAALVTGMVVEDDAADGRYRFSHALVQETLYDELSAVRSARLHARVGAAIETLPRDAARVAELAQHFYRAASVVGPEKGLTYALEAADAAQAGLAYEAVELHLRRALSMIDWMPDGDERDRQELRVQNRLALSMMMNGGLVSPLAAQACDRAAELALALGDTRELLSSMAGQAKVAIVHAEWGIVSDLGARMVRLGEASGDDLCRAAGLFALGNAEVFRGGLRGSLHQVEEAGALARSLWEQRPEVAFLWVNPLVFTLVVGGLLRTLVGEEERATAAFAEAEELARSTGYPFWLAAVDLCNSVRHACAGRVAEALATADECVVIGSATGLREMVALARVVKAWGTARVAPEPDAVTQLQAAIAACDAAGVRMWRPFRFSLLADALGHAGRPDEAVRAADEGLAECEATGERVCEAELHRLRGEALLAAAPELATHAEAALDRAVVVAESQGARLFLGRAESSLGRLPRKAAI